MHDKAGIRKAASNRAYSGAADDDDDHNNNAGADDDDDNDYNGTTNGSLDHRLKRHGCRHNHVCSRR